MNWWIIQGGGVLPPMVHGGIWEYKLCCFNHETKLQIDRAIYWTRLLRLLLEVAAARHHIWIARGEREKAGRLFRSVSMAILPLISIFSGHKYDERIVHKMSKIYICLFCISFHKYHIFLVLNFVQCLLVRASCKFNAGSYVKFYHDNHGVNTGKMTSLYRHVIIYLLFWRRKMHYFVVLLH